MPMENDYIDYLMGFGPMILGHAYPTVIDTVTKYLVERGNVYNFGHTLEVELAEKLVQIIPSAGPGCLLCGRIGCNNRRD